MNRNKIVGIIGLALLTALALITVHFICGHAQAQASGGGIEGLFAVLDLRAWGLDFSTLGQCGAGLALASAPLAISEEQVKEFQGILGEMKGGWNELKNLPAGFKSLQGESAELKQQVTEVRRLMASRSSTVARVHKQGAVSEECARNLAAHFVAHCERSGK